MQLLRPFLALSCVLLATTTALSQTDDVRACEKGSPREAIAACGRLISSGKHKGRNLSLLLNLRGGAFQEKGEHESAIADFDQAIQVDLKFAPAYINRGVSWATLGEYDNAIRDFNEAIRLEPKNALAFNNRGGALRDKQDYDEAMGDFNTAIAIDKKYVAPLYNRGNVHQDKHEFELAVADYSAALKLSPKDHDVLRARGRAWSSVGDLERAKADYVAALAAPAKDRRSRDVQDAVRTLLQLIEETIADRKRSEVEEAAQKKQAELLKEQELAKQAELAKQSEIERQAALAKQAEIQKQLELAKQAELAKLAEIERQAALAKQSEMARLAEIERQAALAKQAELKKQLELAEQAEAARLAKIAKQAQLAKEAEGRKQLERAKQAEIEKMAEAEAAGHAGRVALVIGNSRYMNFPKLQNPRNDAEDLGRVLTELGFRVSVGLDLKRTEMEELLIRFGRAAKEADTAVVFYAGHGIQHGGINYLAPVDARIEDEKDLRRLISLQSVTSDLQGAKRVRIMIVDACRDNRAVLSLSGAGQPLNRSAGGTNKGLARMDATDSGVDGTLIAFATQPNHVAQDGAGRNSPFTEALLKHISTPGLELRTLLTRVRAEVVNATSGRQRPEVWDSLVGEFMFKLPPGSKGRP